MSGWIKLHRSITEHWLYKEKRIFSKFEAWNDILLTVNYAEAKTIIKGNIYYIKRGQSILSLESWGKRWNWDKHKVRRFFKVLEKDLMIDLQSDTTTTRLTVCKYDSYQDSCNTDATLTQHTRNADATLTQPIKEEEEEIEEKKNNKFDFKKSLLSYGFNSDLVSEWLKLRKSKGGINSKIAFNGFIREVELNGNDKNLILQKCIERGWRSFDSSWFVNKNNNNAVATSSEDLIKQFKNKF